MGTRCTTEKLKKLRHLMKNKSVVDVCLQAYIIPSCDAHQSEYISSCDKRRELICGFSGSSGTAVVTEDHAALWTDGKYFLQAQHQLDDNWTLMKDGLPETPSKIQWLSDVLPTSSNVGADPFLIDFYEWSGLSNGLKAEGHTLVPVDENLIDLIWEERSKRPHNDIEFLSHQFSGYAWDVKIGDVRKEMTKNKASVLIVTALSEIAWLFNLRGSDVEYNPVFFSYAVVTLKSIHLFLDKSKLSTYAVQSLQINDDDSSELHIHPYEDAVNIIKSIIEDEKEGKFWISGRSSYALASLLPKDRRLIQGSPVAVLKVRKNDVEIAGAIQAHKDDAVALCEFFAWLSNNVSSGNITEISAAEKLESFKKLHSDYIGPSFATISASGPNGAIIHYIPDPETDRKITKDELYLCDCGSQYRYGTTDITRTVHFGDPTNFQKECYTLVLKGQIAVSMAIFPKFLKGIRLDSFARQALWKVGLDYMHGTGHGVGAYLNVHEGPIQIHYSFSYEDPGLEPGMILSIEPGYYQDDEFGIRLENLAVTKMTKTQHNFRNTDFLTFDTLSLVPYQSKLIEPSMLSAEEINWVNEYHAKCREVIGKELEQRGKSDALKWLLSEAVPLG